jgi:hypothetical protein
MFPKMHELPPRQLRQKVRLHVRFQVAWREMPIPEHINLRVNMPLLRKLSSGLRPIIAAQPDTAGR